MNPKSRCFAALATAAWLGLVAAGFALWDGYDSTAGAQPTEPGLSAATRGDGWELVVFLHPHCPCSRATLDELAELLARTPRPLHARVLFVRPPGAPEGWERTELWATAAELKGACAECDRDGAVAKQARATTSGYAVLYDPAGRVAFHGGLTRGRGRAGESAGRRAILSVLAGQEPESRAVPVFGCSLFSH